MSTRTITLTGRPPVSIDEDQWPLLADARDTEHDGQVACQANRQTKWAIMVRQHEDGRAIVYATYAYDTRYQSERCESARHGDLLPAGSDLDAICRAIEKVAARMPGERWSALAAQCIADLPAESI